MPHGSSSKNFWKFCKLLFVKKTKNFDDKITLMEKIKVVCKNDEIAS